MLTATLAHRRADFTLDVSFQTTSAITGIYGPSGSGKTTLLHLIAGLETPDSGRITLGDSVLFNSTHSINIPPHRRRIGLVFQEHRLFPHYTVAGNLRYGLRLAPPRERRWTLAHIADLLELGPLLPRRISTLSGGERQRVALGRALLASPRLLLLDEPLSSLDPRLKSQILPFLERIRDTAPIPMLYVSHDAREVQRLTDSLILLRAGRILARGRLADLLHEHAVLDTHADLGLSNVLHARIDSHEPDDGLTHLCIHNAASSAPPISAPLSLAPLNATVSISIRPTDLALTLGHPQGLSLQNQFPATIARITILNERAMVELDCGFPLTAEISRRSVVSLDLRPSARVTCLFKSQAVEYL